MAKYAVDEQPAPYVGIIRGRGRGPGCRSYGAAKETKARKISRLGSGAGAVSRIGITEAIMARCGMAVARMSRRRGSRIDGSFVGKAITSAGEAGC